MKFPSTLIYDGKIVRETGPPSHFQMFALVIDLHKWMVEIHNWIMQSHDLIMEIRN